MEGKRDSRSEGSQPGESGFTIVEMVVALAITALALIGASVVTVTTMKTSKTVTTLSGLNQRAHRAIDAIAEELMATGPSAIDPLPNAASSIAYRRCIGFSAGARMWGPRVSITLEYEPNDPDDGVDNDGDGLTDEGRIVWRRNPGLPNEEMRVLATGVAEYLGGEVFDAADNNGNLQVDERGLMILREGDTLRLFLTMGARTDDGQLFFHTAQTSITFRN